MSSNGKRLSPSALEEFYDQLAELLKSGVNLPDAVKRLPERVPELSRGRGEQSAYALNDGDVTEGLEALMLPKRDVYILRGGHRAGGLRETCEQLATVYREWNEVRGTALFSLFWIFGAGAAIAAIPGVLILMGLGVQVAMSTGDPGTAILTGALVGGGVSLVLVIGWALFLWWTARSFHRLFMGIQPSSLLKAVFSLPVLSDVFEHLEFALFYMQWRLQYQSGVPPDQIMEDLDRSFPESETILSYVASQFEQGRSIRGTGVLADFLPGNDYGRLCTGEEAGQLQETLDRLQRDHFQSFLEILENLPGYLRWFLIILYGSGMLFALVGIIYVLISGGGILSSSALPDGALP